MTAQTLTYIRPRGWATQTFTSNGTWTHPAPGTPVTGMVIVVGGGGQGGGGRAHYHASSTADLVSGGGGGCGGVVVHEFTATGDVSVIVGTGGIGAGAGGVVAALADLRTLANTAGNLSSANLSNGLRLVARTQIRVIRLLLKKLEGIE